jgi:O-antigen/teichoic acid export membrane protein
MDKLKTFFQNLKAEDSRLRDQAVMSLFSILSLMVNFFSLILFSKIYGPAISGVYAIFVSINNLLLLVASLRLEQAIHVPQARKDAYLLGFLACSSGIVIALIAGALLAIFQSTFKEHYGEGVTRMAWLLPSFLVVANTAVVLQTLMVREGLFFRYAAILLTQTFVSIGIKTLLISFSSKTNPLIWAEFISQIVCCVSYVVTLRKNHQSVIPRISLRKLKELLKEHSEFPLKALPASFIEGCINQLPYIIFTPAFGEASMGHFSRAMQFMGIPSQILSEPVRQTLARYGGEKYRQSGECVAEFKRARNRLLIFLVPVFTISWFTIPFVIKHLLGDVWLPTIDVVRCVFIYSMFSFVCSPLSVVVWFTKRTQDNLIYKICTFIASATALITSVNAFSFHKCVFIWACTLSIAYIFLYLISKKAVGGSKNA